jgi:hypothetical protein
MSLLRKWFGQEFKQKTAANDADGLSPGKPVENLATKEVAYSIDSSFSSIFDDAGTAEESLSEDDTVSREALALDRDAEASSEENMGYDPYDTGQFDAGKTPPYCVRKQRRR